MTAHPTTLTREDIDLLLDDARRRHLIRILTPLKRVEDHRLADLLAHHEHPSPDQGYVRAVEISLEHIHLPMLDDFGVITRENGAVEPTPLVDVLAETLESHEQATERGGAE